MRQTCHVYSSNNVKISSSWWLNHPSEKYAKVKLDHFPQVSGVKFSKKYVSCHHLKTSFKEHGGIFQESHSILFWGRRIFQQSMLTHFPSPLQPRLNFTEPEPPSTNSCLRVVHIIILAKKTCVYTSLQEISNGTH